MSDIATIAEGLAAGRRRGRRSFIEGAEAGIEAERERIAVWHERQASLLEAALEQVEREGGSVEMAPRSMAQVHRRFAEAIRRGDI
jgi:tagatose-1,6-bisphosphate aldolase non-catalytic subunit AgaZ/GatZ